MPLVIELLHPASVVDVGCGTGAWLHVLTEYGVTDVLGVDGEYVPAASLQIPLSAFEAHDLTAPLRLDRSFDLVLCLEVAEHLPMDAAATLADSLVRLAPVILFSAAVPFQPGTGHVNAQWPEYWAKLFLAHEYVAVDLIRPAIWTNPRVEFWYKQNTLLYVKRNALDNYPRLMQSATLPLSIIHPDAYLSAADPNQVGFRRGLQAVAAAVRRLPHRIRPGSS